MGEKMNKPYSESCDQNKKPILKVLQPLLAAASDVLEIGSGTGQHALYFSQMMPHLTWNTSDCAGYLAGINCWLNDAELSNIKAPFELDVTRSEWPSLQVDTVFTANTVHIMHQFDVTNLFAGVGSLLKTGGDFIIYGPFNYDNAYTSVSNADFDLWLKSRDPLSGIKDFEELELLANNAGMVLVSDYEMPANNRILHFTRVS